MVAPVTFPIPPQVMNLTQPFTERACHDPRGDVSFLQLIENVGTKTRDALKNSEALAKKAAIGDADPQAVALEAVNATASLRQFSSVLSTALRSYQELQRMPL